MSFAGFFAANICVYFQYLFMHVVCVIIYSIVIIINSVLTLQVSTAKYPMIADLAK
jgi:hypothetical protein